jgi:hypothetical protein
MASGIGLLFVTELLSGAPLDYSDVCPNPEPNMNLTSIVAQLHLATAELKADNDKAEFRTNLARARKAYRTALRAELDHREKWGEYSDALNFAEIWGGNWRRIYDERVALCAATNHCLRDVSRLIEDWKLNHE